VDPDSCESVRLLVSEVVTNAITHTASRRVVVRIEIAPPSLEVTVDDADSHPPHPRRAGLADTSGRGLTLVAVLAEAWGSRRTPDGKSVWFRLPLGAAGTTGLAE
jgi:anti-sigma regulatory factor (Ser/Thr protein kinase)